MKDTLAIITVAYKNYEVLHDFLKSLENQKDKDFHLFIADASPIKKPITTTVPFTVVPIENKGYSHGINAGIRKAQEQSINQFCVINDDTYFQEDFITTIKTALREYPHSVIGSKIYYAPGYEYHKNQYNNEDVGNVIWYAGGIVDWNHALTFHIGVDEVDKGKYETVEETGFITGCFMAFDQSVIDTIGYWDERYFLYYEDADFCERAKRNNIPLVYNPSIQLWHKNAQSTEGSGSLLHQKYQKKSRLRFAIKCAPLRTKLHVVKNYYFEFFL